MKKHGLKRASRLGEFLFPNGIIARKTKRTENYKLWQDGSHAIDVYSVGVIQQKIDYIHNNPVKNGLVDLPEHYRFSSARDYYTKTKGLVDIELI